ncbi:GTP-binding protein RAD [Aplysia californica]|uniref:GTP-binding protein RAD n=1 Tax=Aplysia californica TaxID=6500 RepID=A0ABM1AFY8_APLCA|nr:GTP-binding protein RAD [Aplysia californica]
MLSEVENRLSPSRECLAKQECSSAPPSRSNSWRSRHRSSIKREKRMSGMARANSASLPDCTTDSAALSRRDIHRKSSGSIKECSLCTVRSFRTTSKGIVDSGSFSKSLSSNSLLSSGSLATSGNSNSNSNSRSASVDRTRAGSVESSDGSEGTPSICVTASYYRTLVLGATGVGKSSLVQQFTRSDSQNEEDELAGVDSGPIVSVQLDGEESTMEFIDGADLSDLECYRADAFVLLYAVSEPESFTLAASLLTYLRQELGTDRTIFLVANKTDLVRQRLVSSQEAMQFAHSNDCHFIETSTALNVNLDELLVGILCKIKYQLTPVHEREVEKNMSRLKPSNSDRRPRSPSRALSVIGNFLKHACRRDSRRGRDLTAVPQMV